MDRIIAVVDTRQQEPYAFDPLCEVVRRALPAGDCSIGGIEDSVAVERKTLEDFVSTVIRSVTPKNLNPIGLFHFCQIFSDLIQFDDSREWGTLNSD